MKLVQPVQYVLHYLGPLLAVLHSGVACKLGDDVCHELLLVRGLRLGQGLPFPRRGKFVQTADDRLVAVSQSLLLSYNLVQCL